MASEVEMRGAHSAFREGIMNLSRSKRSVLARISLPKERMFINLEDLEAGGACNMPER